MADIRIKDLATTATTTASDDFMAVDGVTNGTRKLSAATPAFLTSVTTPSLTSPAATNLTLAGGAGNSSIILTPAGTGNVGIGTTSPSAKLQTQSNIATSVNNASDVDATLLLENTNATGDAVLRMRGATTGVSSIVYGANGASDRLNFIPRNAATARIAFDQNGAVSISSTAAGSSGAGALVVQGGLATGAASYFGGAVTVEKSLNSDLSNFIINTNAGTGAEANLYVSNAGTGATSATLGVMGTGYATVGGFIQDAGVVSSGTGLSGGLSIMARAASSDIRFYAGSHTNLVATFASTGAATFAGAVTFGGNLIVAQDKFSNFDGSGAARMGMQAVSVAPYSVRMLGSADAVNTRDFSFGYYTGDNAANAWNQKASINSYTGAATFAGAVAIGNTTAASVAAPSTHKVSILIGGVQYYLLASNV